MNLRVNNEEKRLCLRPWNEAESRYGCDCFADVVRDIVNGSEMSQEEFDTLVEFCDAELNGITPVAYLSYWASRKYSLSKSSCSR